MEQRKAKQGEYIMHKETEEIYRAVLVFDNGVAIVNEHWDIASASPNAEEWPEEDYLVLDTEEFAGREEENVGSTSLTVKPLKEEKIIGGDLPIYGRNDN